MDYDQDYTRLNTTDQHWYDYSNADKKQPEAISPKEAKQADAIATPLDDEDFN